MGSIYSLIRKNIREMKPYSSARDEYDGTGAVYLDANENPYFPPLNRYPDPRQRVLKKILSEMKQTGENNIFLGNGSDEAIDLLIRGFCEPGQNNIVSVDPTYGMYEVAAAINAVEFRKVPLDENFGLDLHALKSAADQNTSLIFICSPNNPTANSLDRAAVLELASWFEGILVIDEAYIDFSSEASFLNEIENYDSIVVLQTLSKAWGRAGIRLGMAFAGHEIISVLNKIKPPYNINSLSIDEAVNTLRNEDLKKSRVADILDNRAWLRKKLSELLFVEKIYPSDANFILIRVDDAGKLYNYLLERKIIVRNRSGVSGCYNCLRITIGTKEENLELIDALEAYKGLADNG
ncbi:MAG: histidinol-phosphate transaminase [Bacteroidales bacterium]